MFTKRLYLVLLVLAALISVNVSAKAATAGQSGVVESTDLTLDLVKVNVNFVSQTFDAFTNEYPLMGYDVNECQHFSSDLKECLDTNIKPVNKSWTMLNLILPVNVNISARINLDGTLTEQAYTGQYQTSDSCIVTYITVVEREANTTFLYRDSEKFTTCFRDGIWYFRWRTN